MKVANIAMAGKTQKKLKIYISIAFSFTKMKKENFSIGKCRYSGKKAIGGRLTKEVDRSIKILVKNKSKKKH